MRFVNIECGIVSATNDLSQDQITSRYQPKLLTIQAGLFALSALINEIKQPAKYDG